MNRVIYKYSVPVHFNMPGEDIDLVTTSIKTPKGAQLLSFDNQSQFLTCLAMIDPDETREEERHIALLATGAKLSVESARQLHDRFEFRDTVLFNGGTFVLHVFVEKESV